MGLCQNKHIAEEITQIAKNTFYNYCRKKNLPPESSLENMEAAGSLEEKIMDRDEAERIYRILHKLHEPYKEVFWMRTFGELSFKEIGNIHGKTESWARVSYHRAKLMIQEALK